MLAKKMLLIVFILIMFLNCYIAAFADSGNLPLAPMEPRRQDCNILNQTYNTAVLDMHDLMWQCMSDKPKFGWGTSCSGEPRYKAWSQCDYIDNNICKIKEQGKREYDICIYRVRKREESEREEEKLKERLTKMNEVFKKASEIRNFVDDPISYLVDIFNPFPDIVNRLFNYSGHNDFNNFDKNLGENIYLYLHNFTSNSIQMTANPIIREIQSEALKHIAREHAKNISRMDKISSDMRKISADLKSDRVFSNPPVSKKSATTKSMDECAVLKDDNSSRALMNSNRELWLELVRRCE